MRAGLWAVTLALLAGCGGPAAAPQPPPEAATARAAAEEWKREAPVEGVDALAADMALARAERLLAAGTPDAAAFREAEAAYRAATKRARETRDKERERLYRSALEARSKARALRTRLDERRTALAASAAVPGREGELWAKVRDIAATQVFESDAMLATDVSLEKADALFSDGRHEEARATFVEVAGDLETFIARVAATEAQARAAATLSEAEDAVAAMQVRVGRDPPPPARLAEAALDAARRAMDEREFARAADRAGEAVRLCERALRHGEAVEAAKFDRGAAQKALLEWTRSGEAENEHSRAARASIEEGELVLEEDPAAASAAFDSAAASF
ncbi:MAG: hypothetical protein ACHQ1G_04220, partial [Planctomycetota bacterium]